MTDRVPGPSEVDSAVEPDAMSADLPASHVTGTDATDVYEVDDGVVLYDMNNPLAWVESDTSVSVDQMA